MEKVDWILPSLHLIPSVLTYLDACVKGMSEFKDLSLLGGHSASDAYVITVFATGDRSVIFILQETESKEFE